MSPETLAPAAPVGGPGPSSSREVRAEPRATLPVDVAVTAVVVAKDASAWLADCLDALAAQTRPPDRLVVAVLPSTDTTAAIAAAHARVRHAVPDVSVVEAGAGEAWQALDRVVTQLPAQPDASAEWLWVLHDAVPLRADTLARLVEAVRRSPSVGVAGPKVVDAADTRRLAELGLTVTRTGRPLAAPAPGEPDQGQYDGRTDVLAVGTRGMLVRRDVHSRLGGLGAWPTATGAALDLGWRSQLAGHRVVVVPAAVVAAQPDGGDERARRRDERRARRSCREVALTRCSPLALPLLALWLLVSAVLGAVGLLVAKRPRAAVREISDVGALAHPRRVLAARWRTRGTRVLRRRDLDTLFAPPGAAARAALDRVQDAVTPERRRATAATRHTLETGPSGEETESLDAPPSSVAHRVVTHPGVLAVAATAAVTVVAWRDLLRSGGLSPSGGGLVGGELRATATDADGLWHTVLDAWHGTGLGTGDPAPAGVPVIASLTWLVEQLPVAASSRSTAGLALAWLLLLAPALSAWAAYVAAGVVTPSRWARGVAALAWGTSATVVAATATGRVPALAAHVLLPLVLAGYARTASRDGTFTAAFATALGVGVVAAFVPVLLVPAALAALGVAVVGPWSRRGRGLVLLVVPPVLLGPWLLDVRSSWRDLVAPPGLVDTDPHLPPWQTLLGFAGDPGAVGPPGTGSVEAGTAWWWLAAVAGPTVLLGVAGLAVRARGRSNGVGLWAVAVTGVVALAAALASGRIVVGSAETAVGESAPAHAWAGPFVDLWWAALLVGLLAGSRVLLPRRHAGPTGRRVLVWAVVAVAVTPVLVGAAAWAIAGAGDRLSPALDRVPAVAVEQARGPLATRLLHLAPSAEVVDFRLVSAEPGPLARGLDRAPDVDDSDLLRTVGDLVAGPDAAGAPLARLGIGFVQVDDVATSDLTRRLDAAPGLSRLGTSESGILWRVQPLPVAGGAPGAPAPSRIRLVDADGRLLGAVPVSGPHAAVDTDLPPAPERRLLVVAEPLEWTGSARVTVDGVPLSRTAAAQPTYVVPSGGGRLSVDLDSADPHWRAVQLGVLVFLVFMAVPLGSRRSRRGA